MNKKIIIFSLILFSSLGFLSGCVLTKNNFNSDSGQELQEKNAVISITGKISNNGELYFITDSAGTIHDIETYSVDFSEYLGKLVTVSGQYSGNTLFVTEISL